MGLVRISQSRAQRPNTRLRENAIMKTDDPSSKDTAGTPGEGANAESSQKESLVSAAGAAKTANKAIDETARKYLAAAGIEVDLEDIQNRIRDRPLFYLAIAAGVGFVAGGGMASKWGLALLGLAGRRAAAETAPNFGRQMLRQAAGGGAASA
jgi:ElaB/YqjD/DUF883 family membrane-anchored ribosome-binding protein